MAEPLSDSESYALEYLYGGGDEEIECHSVAWVVVRYPQKCVSILHKGPMTQPAGTRMVLERAKVEGKFGSCYITHAPLVFREPLRRRNEATFDRCKARNS